MRELREAGRLDDARRAEEVFLGCMQQGVNVIVMLLVTLEQTGKQLAHFLAKKTIPSVKFESRAEM